jgi:hypothetical protein
MLEQGTRQSDLPLEGLTDIFRRDIEARRGRIFHAIINITQLQILFEEPLFQVAYSE